MATRTKAQLRNAVLFELGALAVGQTASAEDAADVEARIDEMLAMLDQESVITWIIEDDIPLRAFVPLSHIVAETLTAQFGASDRAQVLFDKSERAMRLLRRHAQPAYLPTAVKVNYF